MYDVDDTIAAIATAPGGAARGMIRVSGPAAAQIVGELFIPESDLPLSALRRPTMVRGHVQFPLAGRLNQNVPCSLFLWPNHRSYTRQPTAELHTLGSPPLLDALLAALCQAGARLAAPGEFTLRAFLAGRIDLTQAEAVLGVIDAHGQDDLNAALEQLAGGLAHPLHQLRDDLLQLLAELEAGLDFVDEDIQFVSADEAGKRLAAAQQLLLDVAAQMEQRLVAGPTDQVVLVGPPNAGKSSLFNALVERYTAGDRRDDRVASALVSEVRGTTRDYLAARVMLGGVACELVDTAGIDSADALSGAIERQAQLATFNRTERAAIRLWCIDSLMPLQGEFPAGFDSSRDVFVLTKSDLDPNHTAACTLPTSARWVATSSRTGEGLDALCDTLRAKLTDATPKGGRAVVAATAERCRESVRLAADALQKAAQITADGKGDELAAAELRVSLDALGHVVGAVYTDDLLDRIFSTFCIGK